MNQTKYVEINNNLAFKEICKPISRELELVKVEYEELFNDIIKSFGNGVIATLHKDSNRFLSAALLLLSGKAINCFSFNEEKNLIKLAAIFELIITAIEIHNKLIDYDNSDNNLNIIKTNHKNKMALLGGDVLYSRGFITILNEFPKEIFLQITKLTKNIFITEITNILDSNCNSSLTAKFMGLSCSLGAMQSGAINSETRNLESFGTNFGIAYEMAKSNSSKYSDVEIYTNNAGRFIKDIPASIYKDSLGNLLEHVLNSSYPEILYKSKSEGGV